MSNIENKSSVLSGRKSKLVEDFSVKNIFVISLIVGSIGIISGVLLHSKLFSIITPIFIMACYIYVTFTKDTDLPISVIGDSYYYQGFVFTLVALMTSLFELGVNENVNMNAMVASFGSALVTTIIGLVARLYVTSFSIEAQKRRERLEDQIEKSMDRFAGQIDTLTQQVVASINKVHGQTESTLIETLSNYTEINQQVQYDYKQTMDHSIKHIESGIEQLTSKLENIHIEPDIISKPLTTSLDNLIAPLALYESKYISLNEKFNHLANNLIKKYEESEKSSQYHVNALSNALNKSIEVNTAEYNKNLNDISEGIIASLGDIKDLKIHTEEALENKLLRLGNSVDQITKKLDKAASPLSGTVEVLDSLSNQTIESVSKISETAQEISNSMKSSFDSIDGIERINDQLQVLTENINEFNESLERGTSVNKESANKISDSATATENATEQLAKDIAEVYKQLTIQVRALRSA